MQTKWTICFFLWLGGNNCSTGVFYAYVFQEGCSCWGLGGGSRAGISAYSPDYLRWWRRRQKEMLQLRPAVSLAQIPSQEQYFYSPFSSTQFIRPLHPFLPPPPPYINFVTVPSSTSHFSNVLPDYSTSQHNKIFTLHIEYLKSVLKNVFESCKI